MNKNETLKWYREQLNIEGEQSKIILDNEFLQYDPPVRGIYGIFLGKDSPEICVYVGKAENLYRRMFKGDEAHLVSISKGEHTMVYDEESRQSERNVVRCRLFVNAKLTATDFVRIKRHKSRPQI